MGRRKRRGPSADAGALGPGYVTAQELAKHWGVCDRTTRRLGQRIPGHIRYRGRIYIPAWAMETIPERWRKKGGDQEQAWLLALERARRRPSVKLLVTLPADLADAVDEHRRGMEGTRGRIVSTAEAVRDLVFCGLTIGMVKERRRALDTAYRAWQTVAKGKEKE